MPPSDDLRDSSALRQEGPQQDEPFTELEQDRVNKVLFGRVSERTRIRVMAALSASRTAQAPQQEGLDLATRVRSYLGNGGLFNPELMEHDKVRDLVMDLQARIQVLETSVDYLRYLVDHPVKQWLPIATAPTGEVLLYRPQMPPLERIAVRRANDWCGEKCCPSARPTHWMPLPAPPVAPAEGEQ